MKGEVRRSQLVQTFGVGSILDADGETFLVKDIRQWRPKSYIECQRITSLIAAGKLKSFSETSNDEEYVPVYRFPRWYYCPSCSLMRFITAKDDKDNQEAYCPKCLNQNCSTKPDLIPMRFVAYCDNGHLAEIDWHRWCHQSANVAEEGRCSDKHHLRYYTSGRSGGDFHEMFVECLTCKAKRDLSDIQMGRARPSIIHAKSGQKCCGKQPWQRWEDAEGCDLNMKIEPRGSSSIHRSLVLSALDIEVGSASEADGVSAVIQEVGEEIISLNGGASMGSMLLSSVQDRSPLLVRQIDVLLERQGNDDENAEELVLEYLENTLQESDEIKVQVEVGKEQVFLLDQEYALFCEGRDISAENLVVSFNRPSKADGILYHLFEHIGQVKKLREIRAFKGFVRGDGLREVPPDLEGDSKWIPAIEAFGEGIYFEFNSRTIEEWLQIFGSEITEFSGNQLSAISKLQTRYSIGITEAPLFLVAHTISHVLMRDLTFRSGYSSSALRERIFCRPEENKAAILIYTSDTDTEGTLGGLVDQARPEIQAGLTSNLLALSRWCSADPVCRETEATGVQGVNRSACHCCSLISETSCAHQNAGLNRVLLSGMGADYGEPSGLLTYIEGLNS